MSVKYLKFYIDEDFIKQKIDIPNCSVVFTDVEKSLDNTITCMCVIIDEGDKRDIDYEIPACGERRVKIDGIKGTLISPPYKDVE